MDILKNSAFFCKYHEIKYPSMDKDDFSNVLFDVVGAAKDAKLICDECKKLGTICLLLS
jgi:3-hydroxyisobutyrate dehydrogenase-like beta-hydroxyacid dehydrogenase